jgi:hypothetical protein
MDTIITKEIDGHTIIIGFGKAVIDPMATHQKVAEILSEEIDTIISMVNLLKESHEALSSAVTNKVSNANLGKMKQKLKKQRDGIMEAKKDFDIKRQKTFKENYIYFQPKPGEEISEDSANVEVLKDIFKTLTARKLLKIDGTKIVDNRNRKYWEKQGDDWIDVAIESIDIDKPAAAHWEDELSGNELQEVKEHKERLRIASLTPEQKQKELYFLLDGLLNAAALRKTKLEIEGDSNALDNARAWYDDQKNIAETKYL